MRKFNEYFDIIIQYIELLVHIWYTDSELFIVHYLERIEAVDTLNAAELAVLAAGSATVLWAVLTYLDAGLTASKAATAQGAAIVEVTALNLAIYNYQRVWRLYDA